MRLQKGNIVHFRGHKDSRVNDIMSMPLYLPVVGNVLISPCRAYSDGFFAGVVLVVSGGSFVIGGQDSSCKYLPNTSEFTAFMWGLEQGKVRAQNFDA